MPNEYKIRVMSQAAMYEDSLRFRRDRMVERYDEKDYIAINRFITKAWMTVFYLLAVVGYAFLLVYVQQVDLLHYDYQGFLIGAVLIYLVLSVAISALSSFVYGCRYRKAKKRMQAYFAKLDLIDRFQKN